MPQGRLSQITNFRPHDDRPSLPVSRPDVPEGCPGNPVQASNYLIGVPDAWPSGKGERKGLKFAGGVRLFATENAIQAPEYRAKMTRCRKRLKTNRAFLESHPSGLHLCRFGQPTQDALTTFVAEAPLSLHATPINQSFLISCLDNVKAYICYSKYLIRKNILISYRIFITDDFIINIIKFDKNINSSVEELFIK